MHALLCDHVRSSTALQGFIRAKGLAPVLCGHARVHLLVIRAVCCHAAGPGRLQLALHALGAGRAMCHRGRCARLRLDACCAVR